MQCALAQLSLAWAASIPVAIIHGRSMAVATVSCPRVDIPMRMHGSDRRAVCGSLLAVAALATAPAAAKVDSVNPANNYYFPMARYRYAPRIFRAWIAVDELAPGVAKAVPYDWEGMEIVWYRLDDATARVRHACTGLLRAVHTSGTGQLAQGR